MKFKLLTLTLLLSIHGWAVEADLSRLCYTTVDNTEFCLDNPGKVQVLIYNAGWCPSCNSEMDEIPSVYSQFKEKQVIFASLSGEGWERGTKPDVTFLKEWKNQHNLPVEPNFIVAGTYKDFGKHFDSPGYIPFAVILNQKGAVAKSGNLETYEIAAKVKELLH